MFLPSATARLPFWRGRQIVPPRAQGRRIKQPPWLAKEPGAADRGQEPAEPIATAIMARVDFPWPAQRRGNLMGNLTAV